MKYNLNPWAFRLLAGIFSLIPLAAGAAPVCDKPITDDAVASHFERLALKQLRLEFGDKHPITINEVRHTPVGTDLIRVEASADYVKPGQAEASTSYLTGWITRCQGTLVLRNGTWLADGTLAAPRFKHEELPGRGLVLGDAKAPLKVLAFVDSRCSQCHRLITYARKLVKAGELQIELRQVAYLESETDAVRDTRISETPLVDAQGARFDETEYLEMLYEFNNDEPLDRSSPMYAKGLALIQTNTGTARDLLQISNVPGVLVYESEHKAYRKAGYWEMNRLFQPDL